MDHNVDDDGQDHVMPRRNANSEGGDYLSDFGSRRKEIFPRGNPSGGLHCFDGMRRRDSLKR